MDDEMRWAARFAFLEERWDGRARLIVDPALERWLAEGVDAGADESEPLAELVDRLLPPSRGPRTWMATHEPATGRELARTRPATGFVGVDMLSEVIEHRDWAVAMIDLTEVLAERPIDGADPDAPRRLPPLATRWIAKLGAAARAGRTVAIVVPATTHDSERGFDEVEAADLLVDGLGGGRMFGVYRPPMAGIVDYGAGEPEPTGEDDDETLAVAADDDVALSFDNTLGTQEPRVAEWLLVSGDAAGDGAEGLTLLELPPVAARDPLPAHLRAQLGHAQREADRTAIAAHSLAEQIDALQADNETLRARVAELEDDIVRAVHAEPVAEVAEGDAERLEVAQAQLQTLRWQVAQLQDQLLAARARPVHDMEAALAQLKAQLSNPARVRSVPAEATARPTVAASPARTNGNTAGFQHAVGQIDALLARIERGGLPNVQLRDALLELKTRLRRAAAQSAHSEGRAGN